MSGCDINNNNLAESDSQLSALWWSPPPKDFAKLNVDGSFIFGSCRMGVGGLIRDSKGDWLWGFSGSLGQGIDGTSLWNDPPLKLAEDLALEKLD
ncbi:putative ribonuclease H-like domain-containing protein [Sesbania bispinosa]|nr:putative ribonuclease H-like domain-containing protein [Sesbania bispinosa]